MLRETVTALAVALPFGLGLTAAAPEESPEPVFRFQDPAVVESSGLAVVDGLVVTVNDSGDEPRVFAVDPASGRTVGVTRWQGEVTDVEAIAPAGRSEVWVGDIGDNAATRDTITVFRVPVGRGERQITAAAYRLRYPDGPHDAEALLAEPGTGRLVVVTKGIFGGEVYAAPHPLRTGEVNRLSPVEGARPRVMSVVTDGAFLPDGDRIVLRDYSSATVYGWPRLDPLGRFGLPAQQQGEGIATTGSREVLVSSEGSGSPVYRVTVPRGLRPAARESAGPSPSAPPARSREGEELPEGDATPDPVPWLVGGGMFLLALLVLWRALRPR